MIRETAPGIFMITQTMNRRFVNFSANIYALAGRNGILFDAGFGNPRSGRILASEIRKIERQATSMMGRTCRITRVIPSHGHWDHFSGVRNLHSNLGLRVLLTRRMANNITSKQALLESMYSDSDVKKGYQSLIRRAGAEFLLRFLNVMPVSCPYETMSENRNFIINGRVWKPLALPGHCDDDIGLYDEKGGILLGGDVVLKRITPWLGPPRSDLDAYVNSLKYLLSLPGLSLILPAHGSPILNPGKRIRQILAHREKRTMQVYAVIYEAGMKGVSFDSIYDAIYPSARFRDRFLNRGWIQTTLCWLVKSRRVSESFTNTGVKRYTAQDPPP